MQFLVIFFLYALAVGNAEECSESKAEACLNDFIESIFGDSDTNEEGTCRELRSVIDCLRNVVMDCSDEEKEEFEEGLQELDRQLEENCEGSEAEGDDDDDEDEDEKLAKCFTENEDYVYECIYEGSTQALSLMRDDYNENALKCAMYSLMASCFVERIGEKCGEKAADMAAVELKDEPEIQKACDEAALEHFTSIQLLDKKRK